MNLAELAKKYLRELPGRDLEDELNALITEKRNHRTPVTQSRDSDVLVLLQKSLMAVSERGQTLTPENIRQEIDRRFDLVYLGWERKGDDYVKDASTPKGVAEVLEMMREFGLKVDQANGFSDNSVHIATSPSSHQRLMLILERRGLEMTGLA